MTIDSFAPGAVLSIENTATAAAPITINISNQTLQIGSGGNLTINGGAESITNGTIKLSTGGQLSDSSGFTIGSSALLIGSGKVTGPISGSGIVEASGGTLELVSPIPGSAGTAFEIANSIVAALLLDSAPGTGDTFTFLGAHDPDGPVFTEGGCYPAEGGHAWTDGELLLPARLCAHLRGGFTLIVHTRKHATRYPTPAALAQAA